MTLVDWGILLVVAAICGGLGQAISGYTRGGCIVSIVLGFVGAMLGAWMGRNMGLPELLILDIGAVRFPIVWSIIGATLFVAIVGFFSRRPSRY